jgi:hypothetical protein
MASAVDSSSVSCAPSFTEPINLTEDTTGPTLNA